MSSVWLRVAVVLYAAGLLHTILSTVWGRDSLFRLALAAFRVGIILHTVSFVEEWHSTGNFPANTFHETFSLCGLLIGATYLFAQWRYRFDSLSIVMFPLVFLISLVASTGQAVGSWTSETVRGIWLSTHVVLALLGYAALLLTAVSSGAYLIQERRLKRKKLGGPQRLPSLGVLDEIISRSISAAFVLITLSVVAGVSWAFIEVGTRWMTDPKVGIFLFTWALVLAMVFFRTTAGWRGRKAAILSLTILGFSAITWAAHSGLRAMWLQ